MSQVEQTNVTSDALRAEQAMRSICSAVQNLEYADRCLERISSGAPGGSQFIRKLIEEELPRLSEMAVLTVRLGANIKATEGGAL